MARCLLTAIVVVALGCGNGSPPSVPGTPQPPPGGTTPASRVLVVTHTTGFRHGSIPVAEATLRDIGTGLYEAEFCRTQDDVRRMLTKDGLARYQAVFFANTTGDLGIPDLDAFLGWIADGGAFLGAHSASDTYHESVAYLTMLGGEFQTHGAIVETEVVVDDPSHPAVAHLAPRFRMTDELYRFSRNSRADVRVLLSLDRNPNDGVGPAGQPADLPMAWHKTHGKGRVFYTAFGHRDEVWEDARFREHLRRAIVWAIAR